MLISMSQHYATNDHVRGNVRLMSLLLNRSHSIAVFKSILHIRLYLQYAKIKEFHSDSCDVQVWLFGCRVKNGGNEYIDGNGKDVLRDDVDVCDVNVDILIVVTVPLIID
jgi:hypothetical protein